MATRTVGPNSQYATIAAAMIAAGPNDLIQLEFGYKNETATVTHSGMTIFGGLTSTGIVLQLGAGISAFTLTGNAPINILDSSLGQNIVGNEGNNVVTVTDGADAVNGGLGHDRLIVDYHLATGAVTGDSTSNFTEAGGSRLVTITSGTFEDFTVRTGSGADTITTYGGDDYISTGSGAGTVSAGQGANTVLGGNNADTITALDGGNYIDGGHGTNIITTGGGSDTVLTGLGADTVVTGGGGDLTVARGGADSLDSGAGEDRLALTYGAMTTNVTGGITGGNFGTGYTGHIADLAVSEIDFSNTEDFTITTGSGNDNIRTGDGADILSGGDGNDTFYSGAGNDRLTGGLGSDNLFGGLGEDSFNGGGGVDYARYGDGNYGNLTIRLDKPELNVGAAAGDTYVGIEGLAGGSGNDLVVGDSLANSLFGQNGDDRLNGLAGNDRLIGGLGSDELTGGTGTDQFIFASLAEMGTLVITADEVMDFSRAQGDRIDLQQIDAKSGTSPNDAFTWIGTSAFHHVKGELHYSVSGGDAYLSGDVDGNGAADFIIRIDTMTSLSAGDFIL